MTPMTPEELGVFHAMKPGRWYLDREIAIRVRVATNSMEIRPILKRLTEKGAIVTEHIKRNGVHTYSRPDR